MEKILFPGLFEYNQYIHKFINIENIGQALN